MNSRSAGPRLAHDLVARHRAGELAERTVPLDDQTPRAGVALGSLGIGLGAWHSLPPRRVGRLMH